MTTATTDEDLGGPPSIHVLMGKVLADLPAIGKDQRNSEQGFMFRGYDDVMNGLNPILARHGVFFVPDVIERVAEKRATRSGGTMYEVNLHVRFTFYGPRGDSVQASGWGEGTDMGDKATNKAMTNALKYVLFQTFAISTREAAETDADRHTPEESVPDAQDCRFCGRPVAGARTDREPMRAHVVADHGWIRQADGSVLHPDAHAKALAERQAEDAARGEDPQAQDAAPAAPATPQPDEAQQPSTPGENPVDDTPAPVKKAAPRKRAAAKAADPAPDPEPTPDPPAADPEPDPRDDTPDDPADDASGDAGDDAAAAVTDTDPDPDGGQDDTGWQCPDCTAAPFPAEEDYTAHWYAEHGTDEGAAEQDGTSDEAAAGDAAPAAGDDDLPTLIADVKGQISALTGADARAYGAYRREHSLPRPDDLTVEQAHGLLEFLAALSAK